MTLTIVAQEAPLQANALGVFFVGTTRVTLDTVVFVFNQGLTAEEIVYRYPSLKLADVYATIAFYLNHQQEVEAYCNNVSSKYDTALFKRFFVYADVLSRRLCHYF